MAFKTTFLTLICSSKTAEVTKPIRFFSDIENYLEGTLSLTFQIKKTSPMEWQQLGMLSSENFLQW